VLAVEEQRRKDNEVKARKTAQAFMIWESVMELTKEQLEVIRKQSREIEYGRIVVDFSDNPANTVTINAERRYQFRYHGEKPEASYGKPMDKWSN
jgi:hypothetical protein